MGDILRNQQAFLALIRWAEGTDREPDAYRVCYGYKHTIKSLAEHPALSGEWKGERLPDEMCRKAGLGSGCVSTAAGAYQLIKPTWRGVRDRLRLPDFGPENQDRAALYLVANCGALQDVHAGRIRDAVSKCSREWASLPGNFAGQPQRKQDDLIAAFQRAGGVLV
ncbi:glycoside hydrolase family 24 protein [Variovorax soli]|uniref:glycoside hydrolase family 24 protein n=1 Tax=Variovorax soli TaxID=376815 RepID=UPI000838A98D|nr:glycoside hydrolase family 104 protein [Variovorax soli]